MNDTQKVILNIVALVVIGVVIARLTLFELVVVDTNAMAPTLTYGDEVLVLTVGSPEMADIVICEHPVEPGVPVWGRIITFAGHTISTDRRGGLMVDGDRANINVGGNFSFYDVLIDKEVQMEYGEVDYFGRHDHAYIRRKGEPLQLRATKVKSGAYLLADNRSAWNEDSRRFGEVDLDTCIGTVFMRWKPAPDRGDDVDHGYLELIR